MVVHDWLVTNAGAEKVLRAILEIHKDADIFSLVDFLTPKDRVDVLKGKFAKTSFIQKLPFAKNHFRNYLPLFPMAIESLDLSSYDLIISSSWAVAKGVKKSKEQLHICYCYTPIRYAWDLYDEYTKNLKEPKRSLVQLTLKYIAAWDLKTTSRVDLFLADSAFVQERIKRIYNRDSIVVYPPIDTQNFKLETTKSDFYLSASRLVPYKKTKLIVEAFNEMSDKKLVVIGSGEEFEEIKKIAKPNTTLLGFCEDDVLISYMQRAKGFVYAAVEDFGIVPIEAMSCGTPVIALNDGGTAETVVDGVNGVHFEEQNIESIKNAIKRFETLEWDAFKIRESALKYEASNFEKNFKLNTEKFVK